MNNYLNGDDMWPYVTMWEYEERIIPLRKIVDIFHESCNQKLKCYILTSPLDEERFSVLKAHDDLDFHWVERLDDQDLNGLVGLFSFKELDSADRLDEVYFGDSFSPVGTILLSVRAPKFTELKVPYMNYLRDPTERTSFYEALLSEDDILAYEVAYGGSYQPHVGCRTDRFVFLDEKLLEKRDLFLWSKVISAQW